jgi:hypothetical protein
VGIRLFRIEVPLAGAAVEVIARGLLPEVEGEIFVLSRRDVLFGCAAR